MVRCFDGEVAIRGAEGGEALPPLFTGEIWRGVGDHGIDVSAHSCKSVRGSRKAALDFCCCSLAATDVYDVGLVGSGSATVGVRPERTDCGVGKAAFTGLARRSYEDPPLL